MRDKIAKVEQADAKGPDWNKGRIGRTYHRFLKRRKVRLERRRANAMPDCQPAYGKYRGWET